MCANCWGMTLLSLGKFVSGGWKGASNNRRTLNVGGTMQIPPGCGKVDQLFTLAGLMGVYTANLHVFCGVGKGIESCPSESPVGYT